MSDCKGSRFFEGLMIGGLLGVVAGMLLAPKPGEELRKELSEKAYDAYDKVNKALRESKDAIEIAIAQGKDMADETREEVIQALESAREKVESIRP